MNRQFVEREIPKVNITNKQKVQVNIRCCFLLITLVRSHVIPNTGTNVQKWKTLCAATGIVSLFRHFSNKSVIVTSELV